MGVFSTALTTGVSCCEHSRFGQTRAGAPAPQHSSSRSTSNVGFRPTEDYFWVEEGACYAGGDGNQVALAGEDFDLAGAGEFEEIDGASVADAGGGELVGGYRGHLRKELAWVDEEFK